jgi:hypothetical protein
VNVRALTVFGRTGLSNRNTSPKRTSRPVYCMTQIARRDSNPLHRLALAGPHGVRHIATQITANKP